ncbi:MAG: hypothetical protein VKK32_02115 [Candidatus Melainabacteria bacterium]|nr:hypothetical protein [Candidatus Melainabacteria bacterium]
MNLNQDKLAGEFSLKVKTLNCNLATGGKGFDEPYLLVMPFTESGIVTQYYLSEPQSQVTNGFIWNLDKEMILELNDSVPEINILISLYEKDNGQLYGFLKQQLENNTWPLILSETKEWVNAWSQIKLKAPSLIKNTALSFSATKLSLEVGKLLLGALKLIGKQSLKDDDLGSVLLTLDRDSLKASSLEKRKIEFTGKDSDYELTLELVCLENLVDLEV